MNLDSKSPKADLLAYITYLEIQLDRAREEIHELRRVNRILAGESWVDEDRIDPRAPDGTPLPGTEGQWIDAY